MNGSVFLSKCAVYLCLQPILYLKIVGWLFVYQIRSRKRHDQPLRILHDTFFSHNNFMFFCPSLIFELRLLFYDD